jgi:hypothetical protein
VRVADATTRVVCPPDTAVKRARTDATAGLSCGTPPAAISPAVSARKIHGRDLLRADDISSRWGKATE